MKKFSQAIPALHEAEGAAKSELQKSYAEYFKAKLNKFGAKSPAELTPEQKSEFFNEITKDWTRGEGATKAGQADIEEHGVKESEVVNELKAADLKPGKKYKSAYGEVTFIKLNPDGKTMELHSEDTGKVKTDLSNAMDMVLIESAVNEAEVKSEAEFKEYAMALLKKAHPDDFDEAKANATVEGILKKCDGDFGAAVGMITSSLGESTTNEKKDGITPEEMARIQQLKKLKDLKANEGEETCPMCKKDPCECYTNEGNAFGDAVKKAKEAGEKEFEFQGKTYKVEESEAGAPNDLNEGADVTPYLDEVKKALPQLEDLIKKKLGFAPKLTADKKGNDRIFIQSSELIGELGKTLVKTLFTKIELGFWGGNVTSDGKSIWFNPKIWYEHPGGGSNGADFVWDSLWWDLASKKWVEGRSLIK